MAGLNIPKREQLENGPKLSDLNRARLKAQDRLSDYAGRMAEKGADIADLRKKYFREMIRKQWDPDAL